MATQFDFSNDDWERVAAAPLLVGMAVAKAEDSGFLGSIRETRALLSNIADGADDPVAIRPHGAFAIDGVAVGVGVARLILHRVRCADAVHQADRAVSTGHNRCHLGVETQG